MAQYQLKVPNTDSISGSNGYYGPGNGFFGKLTVGSLAFKLESVTLRHLYAISNSILYVRIYSGNGSTIIADTPSQAVSTTGTRTDELFTFTFSSPILLSANTSYWIGVFVAAGGGNFYFLGNVSDWSTQTITVGGFSVTTGNTSGALTATLSDTSQNPQVASQGESGGFAVPHMFLNINSPNTAPNAPTASITGVSSGIWTSASSVTVNWVFNDPDAGDTQSAYRIVGTNNNWASWGVDTGVVYNSGARSAVINIPYEGTWQFAVMTWDAAGASSPWGYSVSFYVDRTAPTGTSVTGTQYLNVAPGGTYRIYAYGITDNMNAVSSVKFPVWAASTGQWVWRDGVNAGGGTWYCDIPISDHASAEGIYQCDVYAYDLAGNSRFIGTNLTYIDRTAPTITSPQGYSYTNQTTGTRRVWVYGINDAVSGVDHVDTYYKPPGGSFSSVQATVKSGSDWYFDVPLSAQGQYQVDFYAVDKAGNSTWPAITSVYFFVDSQRANDPIPSVVWGMADATFTWSQFSDPAPSSGWKSTEFYLGEWDGSQYVGTPLFNGISIGDVTSKYVTGLTPGKRYRYTVTYHDNAGNESAYTYFEFVTKKKIGEHRTEGASGVISLPIYDPASGVLNSALRLDTPVGIGCFELVPVSNISASPLRIETSYGVKAIAK